MPREAFHQELDELVEDVVGLDTELEAPWRAWAGRWRAADVPIAEKELGVDVRYKPEPGVKWEDRTRGEGDHERSSSMPTMQARQPAGEPLLWLMRCLVGG